MLLFAVRIQMAAARAPHQHEVTVMNDVMTAISTDSAEISSLRGSKVPTKTKTHVDARKDYRDTVTTSVGKISWVSCDEKDNRCLASEWARLGEDWWLPFADGWSHRWGVRAFDGTIESRETEQDGEPSPRLEKAIKELNDPDSWNKWNQFLPAIIHLNNVCLGCPAWKKHFCWEEHWWSEYSPVLGANNQPPRAGAGVIHPTPRKTNNDDAGPLLRDAYDQYEREKGRVSAAHAAHPRKALANVLHPLARFISYLAVIHPFHDGNSRTRNIVLQVLMVRAGGHPLILPDIGWWIYDLNAYEDVYRFLLNGWCAYEYYLRNGITPYVALAEHNVMTPTVGGGAQGIHSKAFGKGKENMEAVKISMALYDARTDECRNPNRADVLASSKTYFTDGHFHQ
jgi:hypothetical protein